MFSYLKSLAVALPGSGQNKASLAEAPAGNSGDGQTQQQQPDSYPAGAQNIWDPNKRETLLKARDPHRVLANVRGRVGALLRADRRKGSGKPGNRAMPEEFGRTSG